MLVASRAKPTSAHEMLYGVRRASATTMTNIMNHQHSVPVTSLAAELLPISLAAMANVAGGSMSGPARLDPGHAPGNFNARPRTTKVNHTSPLKSCISGAVRGAASGGLLGGPPGAAIGAVRGCAVSTILRPLPAY